MPADNGFEAFGFVDQQKLLFKGFKGSKFALVILGALLGYSAVLKLKL